MTTVELAYPLGKTEPCLQLTETEEVSPELHSWRRFQKMWVIRNDRVVTFKRDMGPREAFPCRMFNLIGGTVEPSTGRGVIDYTVEEMMEMADEARHLGPLPAEDTQPSDLKEMLLRQQDELAMQMRGKGISAPSITKVR